MIPQENSLRLFKHFWNQENYRKYQKESEHPCLNDHERKREQHHCNELKDVRASPAKIVTFLFTRSRHLKTVSECFMTKERIIMVFIISQNNVKVQESFSTIIFFLKTETY